MMLTSRQIAAARAMLGWSQQDLADKAVLSRNVINNVETGASDPRASSLKAIQATFEKAGIAFIWPEGSEGVIFLRDKIHRTKRRK